MTETLLVYGLHAVGAALERSRLQELWVDRRRRDVRLETLVQRARRGKIAVHEVDARELEALAGEGVHQGVVGRSRAAPTVTEADLEQMLAELQVPPLLLVLDCLQDPHNLGACLRTADAAGVHAVIAPRDRAVGLTPVVRKVASGAAEHIPLVQVTNLARTLRELKDAGIWLIGAAGEAEGELYDADLRGPLALVMGAEGSGLRRLTREHCDLLVRIPMAGAVESLNVSVATGVCLFEAVRQRRTPAG